MSDDWKPKGPDFKGDGIAVWKATDKNGKLFLKVKVLGTPVVNCFKVEEKPKEDKPKETL